MTQIARDPLSYLSQLGRKSYALLNHWEQYTNKSLAFHRVGRGVLHVPRHLQVKRPMITFS